MRPPSEGTISGAGQTHLPSPVSDRVSMYLIQFESVSFSGSVTIKGSALDTNFSLIALAYKNMNTGVNATDAITGNALVLVDAAGLGVVLDSSVSSGSLKYKAIPMVG